MQGSLSIEYLKEKFTHVGKKTFDRIPPGHGLFGNSLVSLPVPGAPPPPPQFLSKHLNVNCLASVMSRLALTSGVPTSIRNPCYIELVCIVLFFYNC
jgi:hypothetical protein